MMQNIINIIKIYHNWIKIHQNFSQINPKIDAKQNVDIDAGGEIGTCIFHRSEGAWTTEGALAAAVLHAHHENRLCSGSELPRHPRSTHENNREWRSEPNCVYPNLLLTFLACFSPRSYRLLPGVTYYVSFALIWSASVKIVNGSRQFVSMTGPSECGGVSFLLLFWR